MEMGTNKDNMTPNSCVFSEPWSSTGLSVFKNIDDPQSEFVDIRHLDDLNSWNGAVNGINFKTTSNLPLGLDTYCDPQNFGATSTDFRLGLGELSIKGFYYGNYFDWALIRDLDGNDLVVNSWAHENNIDIIYDPDRVKLLGTQNQTTKFQIWGYTSQIRVFFR